ncbi:MAG: 3-deoxy-D-manno-octulosonic acid transferase, partial [Flavobacteriales bacterium]
GGFGAGIHNTLEAAVYGKPVLFGPNHRKFREASGLITKGGGIACASKSELSRQITHMLSQAAESREAGKAAAEYVTANTGATRRILEAL